MATVKSVLSFAWPVRRHGSDYPDMIQTFLDAVQIAGLCEYKQWDVTKLRIMATCRELYFCALPQTPMGKVRGVDRAKWLMLCTELSTNIVQVRANNVHVKSALDGYLM